MIHNIPGDTGGNWRWDKLIDMCRQEEVMHDDPSPSMVLALWANQYHLSDIQKTWLSVLYGLTYSTTSAIFIFRNFPSLQKVNEARLSLFWKLNKNNMYFNRDRRYIKSNDQFIPSIMSIKNIYGSSLKLYSELISKTDEEVYQIIVKRWKYFGRHAAFLFFDAYSKMLHNGICSLSSIDDWREAYTIAEGLALAVYDDELYMRCCNKRITAEDTVKLDSLVDKIIHDVGKPFNDIESTICAYTKAFKGTRYLGYYIDRFQEELAQCSILPKDIEILYELRKKVTPEMYLGECSGWRGIRKENSKIWLNEGRFI